MLKIKKNNGFTLIELMITVAIVGILSSLAVSSYKQYVGRAQIVEAMALMSGAKVKYAEFIYQNSRLAENDEGITILDDVAKSKYVRQVYISVEGRLGATMSREALSDIVDTNLAMEPVITSNGNILWKCYYYGPSKYAPSSCKDSS